MHKNRKYQHLQPEDRMTFASLLQQNHSVRSIATVLRRNTDPEGCASSVAQRTCQQRRRSARPLRKLHPDSVLFALACTFLRLRWPPEKIALILGCLYSKGHEQRVSHAVIYNCIYALPVGELRRDLIACLRQAQNWRTPPNKGQDRRGQPDMLNIHVGRLRLKTVSPRGTGRVI